MENFQTEPVFNQAFLREQRLREKRMQSFPDTAALADCRFDRDCGSVPQMCRARQYAENWDTMYSENVGLLFWGRPGNGKTFAAACIANALLEQEAPGRNTVYMATFGTILRRLLACDPSGKDAYVRQLTSCALLILDDFGMERQTEYAREQIFNIIDGRYLSRMPLIVTTNLSLQQLRSPGSMAEERIYDRILELCVPVCFDGGSFRQSRGAEKLRLFQDLCGGQTPAGA